MNRAKLFIAFTFLSAFALSVSAQEQTPKIVWKNLQEKYEKFEDIKPTIINESGGNIYFDTYFFPYYIKLERFDKQEKKWFVAMPRLCGTGYRPMIKKIKPSSEIPFGFYKEDWDNSTIEDSIGEQKFRKFSDYDGKGKYRFLFTFGLKKSAFKARISYSPEFEVIEKDFKK